VYPLLALYAAQDGQSWRKLAALLSVGQRSGDLLARALVMVRADGSLARAREAVSRSVRRARKLATELAHRPARDALVHIAEFLAVRCGAAN